MKNSNSLLRVCFISLLGLSGLYNHVFSMKLGSPHGAVTVGKISRVALLDPESGEVKAPGCHSDLFEEVTSSACAESRKIIAEIFTHNNIDFDQYIIKFFAEEHPLNELCLRGKKIAISTSVHMIPCHIIWIATSLALTIQYSQKHDLNDEKTVQKIIHETCDQLIKRDNLAAINARMFAAVRQVMLGNGDPLLLLELKTIYDYLLALGLKIRFDWGIKQVYGGPRLQMLEVEIELGEKIARHKDVLDEDFKLCSRRYEQLVGKLGYYVAKAATTPRPVRRGGARCNPLFLCRLFAEMF